MITVVLYRDKEEETAEIKAALAKLQSLAPHRLVEIDINQEPALKEKFSGRTPFLKIGAYHIEGKPDPKQLEITLLAAEQSVRAHQRQIGLADKVAYGVVKHWLLIFNLIVAVYVGLPFLAPVLMEEGATAPAHLIYKAYGFVCHQLAYRSWFLFGEQVAYPRAAAHVRGLKTYEQATGRDPDDLWDARAFIGNKKLGYKVAFCERDVAIWGAVLLFGLLFALTRRKIPPLPWYLWILIGWLPIGIDGFSQIISQLSNSPIPFRESTPLLRTITGFLFGFTTAWFGYPLIEEAMRENRAYLAAKIARIQAINHGDSLNPKS